MNKSISERLAALEAKVSKNLYALITFEDGITERLSLLDMLPLWELRRELYDRRVTEVEWTGDTDAHGIMPDVLTFMLLQNKTEDTGNE